MLRKLFVALLTVMAVNAFAAADVNRAAQAELEAVKGIGPGLSTRILTAREHGAFKDWADLVDRVGGIGRGNAAKLSQAGLTVGGASFDPATLPADTGAKGTRKATLAKAAKAEPTDKADRAAKRSERRAKKSGDAA